MTELTKEQQDLLDKNPDLKAVFDQQSKLIESQSEKLKENTATIKDLEAVVKGDKVALSIPGTIKVKNKEYKFVDGHKNVRHKGSKIPTVELLKLANKDKSVDETVIDTYPGFAGLTSRDRDLKELQINCKAYLTHLVEIKYNYLVPTE